MNTNTMNNTHLLHPALAALGLPPLPWKTCEFPYSGYIEDSTGRAVSNVAVMPDMKSGSLQSRSLEEIAAIARVQAASPQMLSFLLWLKDLQTYFSDTLDDDFWQELDGLLAACGLPPKSDVSPTPDDGTLVQ